MAPIPRLTVRPHRLSRVSRRSRWLLHPLVAALALALPLQSPAQTPPAAITVPKPAAGWRVYGQGPRSAPEISADGRHMRIQQDSARAIYNWASFDIGAESSVTFDMAKAGASALNRVDGTAPSQIFGKLSATNGGEVLIYNRNGILFGRGASVDVGNLIATTLKPRDEDYKNGFVANITGAESAFRFDGSNAGDFGKSFVKVEAGAEIKTAEGGRIFLFARKVENAGTLSAPGGQVVLGAGAEVFYKLPTAEPLYAAENNAAVPALRGLLVEVGRHTLGRAGDGQVKNEASGVINTPRGNTTLVGMAVNQSGRISASTSVAQNGSVLLLAQGGAATLGITPSDERYKRAQISGDLVLDAGSRIEITAADQGADGKALSADDNAGFVNSRLDLAGKNITLARGASIVAPAAQASLRALAVPDYRADLLTDKVFKPEGGRIQIDAGASIDLSGTRNTELSVARHFVTTELLGSNDLKDAPLQKDGLLYRNKVTLDTRQDSLILGSLDSYRRSLQRSASERMAQGGSLKLLAGGAVLAHAESRLAVDGGLLRYLDAEVRPTQLFSASGKAYSLNNAPSELLYSAITNAGTNKARYDRWGPMVNYGTVMPARQEAGYTEGGRGGSLSVVAPEVLLDGALSGQTTLGRRQRIGLDALPAGASLGIGAARHGADFGANAYAGAVLKDFRIGADIAPLDEAQWLRLRADSEAALGRSSGLAASRLLGSGFQHITIAAEGAISSTAALDLPALGSLQLLSRGGRVSVDADIRSASGSLSLRSFRNEVAVAAGVKLDVAGQWSNAALDPEAGALTLKGGTLLVSGDTGVSLGAASRLDVSGGALLAGVNSLAGCAAGQICGGAAGSITLSTGSSTFTADVAARRLLLGGELRGYSMSQGGHLSLTAPGLRIGSAPTIAAPGTLELGPEFFGQGGFGRFSLDGRQALELTAGTRLAPTQQLWHAEASTRKAPSGSAMDGLMTLAAPRQGLPKAIDLSLASSGLGGNRPEGRLSVAEGASIALEPGARLSLSAATALAMDGELRAPGGQLSLAVKASNSGEGDIPHYLWLGAKSRIDVAGQRQLQASTDGLPQGRLLGGGSVSLSASGDNAHGTSLVWQRGAVIDISGASGALLTKEQSQGGSEQRISQLASSAGSLSISGNQDIVLEGTLRAQAGGAGQGGGTLSLSLVPGFVTPNIQGLPALRRLELVGVEERRSDALRAEALPAPTGLSGRASLSTALLRGSGVAELNLSAQEGIVIADGVNLDLARGLKLDTPVLLMQDRAQARLAAPLLQWQNKQTNVIAVGGGNDRPLPTAQAGHAGLSLTAGELMVLDGKLVTQGLGRLNLSSGGDLRLQGTASGSGYQGSLATAADTWLTARQLFPASDTVFGIDAGSHLLEFASSPGAAPALPWSAGGSLKLKAADIVQGGRLRAPAGLIEFQATGQLSLSAGSETSVSAAGRELLFGTWTGERWASPGGAVLGAAPAKAISLNAATVDVAPGALLDLSGGGKLSAWQFVSGPGGSRDVFTGLDGAYAIVPGVLSSGTQALAGEGASALGRQITIGEGAPVPAGTYTLLPARYAVLDGAWLLRPAGVGAMPLGLGVSVARDDGSLLLGARLGLAGSAEQDARTSTWQLLSAAQARKYSEIRLADADQFFPALAAGQDRARPALLRDAGSLVVATQQAQIRGLTRFDAGRGDKGEQGLAGSAYFGAERIQIGGTAQAGALHLDPAQLSALGAQHLVIGAIPKNLSTPEQLELRSSTLELAPGAAPLKAQSLLLAATERLTVGQGARLEAAPVDAQAPSRQWQLQGDGAALLVSGDAEAGLVRSGAQRQRGDLSIGAGSVLSAAGGSLLLDATGRSTLAADATLQADSIALGVSRLQIGGSAALQDDSTLLSAELLAQLGGAERLLLRSYAGFDFLAGASLGAPGLERLSLDGPGLRVLGEGLASVSAARIDIGNSTGLSAGDAPAAGRLRLDASGQGAGQGEIHMLDGSQRWQLGGA
ncbi:filamentous hemagglutinin N-terminal domain-containing protein, partial [Paucibacter sp. XJ19-41]|uniref:filamentous hemagglutinin N-terminal domain-containing protein n=1 Tax=Paucibacter sp. XJ19-41 TaxID=2927824 RepID=UPI00234B18F9